MPRQPRNPGSGKPPHNGPAKGDGWVGGPARNGGSNSAARIAGPGRPPGMKNGEGKAAKARAKLESAAEDAADTVVAIARDIKDPRALQAAQHVLLRVLGDPASLQVTGPGGGPQEIVWRIVDPATD